jgi:hypothetical protein
MQGSVGVTWYWAAVPCLSVRAFVGVVCEVVSCRWTCLRGDGERLVRRCRSNYACLVRGLHKRWVNEGLS